MAWVETRITRTSQPQDTVGIDWSNPLTRGLVRAVNSANLLESVAGATGLQNGTVNRTPGKISFPNGSSLGLQDAPLLSHTLFSLAVVPSSGTQTLISRTSNTGLQNYVFLHENGFPRVGFRASNNSYFYVSSSIAPIVGSVCAYCASHDGLVQRVYTDGVLGAAQSSGGLNNVAGQITQIGALGGADRGLTFQTDGIFVSLIFARALSDAEIKSLSENPWQIFEPEVSRIWVDDYVSAGGGATTVTTDASASYAIRAAITSDAAASYPVRSATSSDTTASYPLRAATQSDAAAAYAIRSAASADALASYYVLGLVQSDTAGSYAVRAAAQSDALASYAIRSAVQSDALASYEILSAGVVFSDSPASYAIRSAVQADAAASYPVRSVAQADAAGAYAVRAAVWADAGASYAVQGALVSVWADATASYFVDGVVVVIQPSIRNAYVPLPRNQAYAPLAANQAYVPTPTNQAYLP